MISIIIPTYNRYYLLTECVKSILNQTFQDFEIIIIDDGSTDETKQVKKLKPDKIVYVNYGKIGNTSKLRNAGIKLSRGEYIAFCDDDDLWCDNRLEEGLKYIEKYNVISSNAEIIDKNNIQINSLYFWDFSCNKLLFIEDILKYNYILTTSILLKKEVLTKNKHFNEIAYKNLAEDYEFWLRVINDNPIFFLNQPLVKIRIHTNNITGSENNKIKLNNNMVEIISQYTRTQTKKIKRSAYIGMFRYKFGNVSLLFKTGRFKDFIITFFKLLGILFKPNVFAYIISRKYTRMAGKKYF